MPTHLRYILLSGCLLFVTLFTESAFAQVEPDTVRRKQELPTGPPMPTPRNDQRQPRVLEQPPVEAKQEVIKDRELQEKTPLIDRLYFGGSFGLQFGTYTNISLLPIVGYRVTDQFNVGGGIVYHFIRSNRVTLQNYGGRAFAQHEILGGLLNSGAVVAHAEYELLSVEQLWFVGRGYETRRVSVGMPMAGLGYRQRISDKASFDLLVLYNFNEVNSPYSNPVIRAGFNIPFRR
ncbi:MAG: hypothetical protein LPK14_02630 [Hymenobacteraceae bacterium]|nr:hypothetical protein [Hymenobacteraceae bacterium]MDX5421121.1 hypothetical protein [Hymenobacteraceae bacterium]